MSHKNCDKSLLKCVWSLVGSTRVKCLLDQQTMMLRCCFKLGRKKQTVRLMEVGLLDRICKVDIDLSYVNMEDVNELTDDADVYLDITL